MTVPNNNKDIAPLCQNVNTVAKCGEYGPKLAILPNSGLFYREDSVGVGNVEVQRRFDDATSVTAFIFHSRVLQWHAKCSSLV